MRGRLLHGDPYAQFYAESVKRQDSKSAWFVPESLVVLHIDRNAGIRKEHRILHISTNAQFRAEREGGFFSKKIYRFHFKLGSQDLRYSGSWTKERYRSLLTQQAKDPVPLTTETKSGRTWWIYRGKFYWEDFSAREVFEKQRVRSSVAKEVKKIFLEGTNSTGDIVKNLYCFHCDLGRRNIRQQEVLTEKQYKSLLNQTEIGPVALLSENGRTWWLFQEQIYWAEDDLKEEEVRKLLSEGFKEPSGISRESSFRFRCRVGIREIQQEEPLTANQYRSLQVKQTKIPVLLLTDSESGTQWWMFRGEFYKIYDELTTEEARASFLEGSVLPDGISRETRYRFRSRLGNQEIQQEGHLSEKQYHSLLASQKETRVHIFSDAEIGKTWTMFRDEFFWEDYSGEENREFERVENNVEREDRLYQKYRRSRGYWRDEEEQWRYPGPQGYWGGVASTMISYSVKDRVWERDQGRCAQCRSEGQVDYVFIRPLSEGLNKTEYNVQLLCSKCKDKKNRDDHS